MHRGGVWAWALGLVAAGIPAGHPVWAASVPGISVSVTPSASPIQISSSVEILLVLTVLSVAPAILLLMTSFTRIVIVLSFLRTALATGQLPPNQIIVGLALVLTVFVMGPTFTQIYQQAWVPYQAGKLTQSQALSAAEAPLRAFMLTQTDAADITMFQNMERKLQPAQGAATTASASGTASPSSVTLEVLVPAFVIHELTVAFEMGFVLFVPFLIIDLVVSSTLMAMGMIMLPPVLISLPFKLLLFVLANGWALVVQSLVLSFHGAG